MTPDRRVRIARAAHRILKARGLSLRLTPGQREAILQGPK